MPDLKVAVGMSRNWDAKAAGKEVAISTLEKLDKKPDVFLLFATIHYDKYGGFEKFLEGVWEHLPKGTPLVGGTVAGFLNGSGSYARGAVAMAISYDSMDIATAIGFGTKRNPVSAANSCANSIKKAFAKTKYKNKFLTAFISGPIFPTMPFIEPFRVIHNKILSAFFTYFAQLSTVFLQKGSAREVEIFKSLSKNLDEYHMLAGTLTDDCNYCCNYQFFGRQVYTNAVICLGIACDLQPKISTSHGLSLTGKKFKITKDMVWRHAICSLDGKPAVEQYLKAVKWPETMLNERIHTKTIFYPLGTVDGGQISPNVIAIFAGDYLVLSHSVSSDELHLLTTSGNKLINAVDSAISEINSNFGFCISCAVRLEALGGNVKLTQKKLKERFSDNFLVIYTAGEGTYSPKSKCPKFFQETFNIMTLEGSR